MFADEAAAQLTPCVARTWAPVGETPVLEHQAGRDKVSLLGGLIWRPRSRSCDLLLHLYPKQNVDAPRLIVFLEALRTEIKGPITLVWDNLKAHHGKQVHKYAADNADWLQIVFLPPYCPEFNPIEYVWSAWKRTPLANYRPKNTDQLCDLMLENEEAMTDQRLLQGCLRACELPGIEELLA